MHTTRTRHLIGLAPAALAVAGLALLVPIDPASAASIGVTTTDDELNADGDCSLREAVQAANTDAAVDACTAGSGADVITLPAGDHTITSQLVASDAAGLTLEGAGAAATAILGSGGHRLIDVTAGELTVEALALTGGDIPTEPGAAIRAGDDGVWITDALLSDNHGAHGGAVESEAGFVNVTRSTFVQNRADSDGLNGNGGAIRTSSGFVNLDESELLDNFAANVGGAISTGTGRVSVVRSTVAGNEARAGGAIYNSFGLITTLNSTLHANTTTDINDNIGGTVQTSGLGGGIHLLHTTLTDTAVGYGVLGAPADGASLIITGSIITGNEAGECSFSGSDVTSAGGNLVGDGSCGVTEPSDQVVADPMLGPLTDNGGLTATRLPLAGSPAIDSATAGSCPESDQRRISRPQDGDGDGAAACDRGAVELAAAPPDVPEDGTPVAPAPSAQPVTAPPSFTG